MTRTFETTANGRTFTIDETDAGRCAFRIDGERVKASRWEAALNVAEGTDAWNAHANWAAPKAA